MYCVEEHGRNLVDVVATAHRSSNHTFVDTIDPNSSAPSLRIRTSTHELPYTIHSSATPLTPLQSTHSNQSLSLSNNLNTAKMSNILSERSSNIPVSPEKKDNKDSKEAPKSLEYHRQILESRLKEEKLVDHSLPPSRPTPSGARVGISHAHHLVTCSSADQTYVSPSDTIQSPATQKLAAFRNKHLKA